MVLYILIWWGGFELCFRGTKKPKTSPCRLDCMAKLQLAFQCNWLGKVFSVTQYVQLERYAKHCFYKHDRAQSDATHSGSVSSASSGKTCAGTILPSFEDNWLKWPYDKYDAQSRGGTGSGAPESTPTGFCVFLSDPDPDPESKICEKLDPDPA